MRYRLMSLTHWTVPWAGSAESPWSASTSADAPVWGLKIEGRRVTRLLRAPLAPLWPHTRVQPACFISLARAQAFARHWGLPLR